MRKTLTLSLLIPLTALLASCGGTTPPKVTNNSGTITGSGNSATTDTGDQTLSLEEAQILAETNAARAVARSCGGVAFQAAPPVTWNGYLARAARAHAADMASKGYFSHVSLNGATIQMRAEAAGYTGWRELGENIAAGYTLGNVVQGWIDSPSHCKTLMNPSLKEIGVGYTYLPGSPYGTYWVQDYGTR